MSNREEALLKVIKDQENVIVDQNQKLKRHKENCLPQISHLQQQLVAKDREIDSLNNEFKSIQNEYHKKKSLVDQYIDKSKSDIDILNKTLNQERQRSERKIAMLEESYKVKLHSLENENKLLTEELLRLKSFYLRDADEKLALQVSENEGLLEDVKKINEFFTEKRGEDKESILQLKKELDENLGTFNQHLFKCTQEKRELSTRYLDDMTQMSPESDEFKRVNKEFALQLDELMGQVTHRDSQIETFSSRLDKMVTEIEQVKDSYQQFVRRQEDLYKTQLEAAVKREVEERRFENERLQIVINEKDAALAAFEEEVKMMKIEAQLMEENLEDIKKIATEKEWNSQNEIQALKLNNMELITLDENRQIATQVQLDTFHKKLTVLQTTLTEREKMSEGLGGILEEVELVHRRIEDACKKQKEFFDRERNAKPAEKVFKGLDNIFEKAPKPTVPELITKDERAGRGNRNTDLGATLTQTTQRNTSRSPNRTGTSQDYRGATAKNVDLDRMKEIDGAKHRNDLAAIKAFWERCIQSVSTIVEGVEHFHEGLKGISNRIESFQGFVLPERKILDSVHEEIEKLGALVEEYNEIKDEICEKMIHEVEIQKYEEKIVKLDQELEVAKMSLIHYMQMSESLKNMINSSNLSSGSGDDKKGEVEIFSLREEISRLQDYNMVLNSNNRSLEEIHQTQIRSLVGMIKIKGDFETKMYAKLEELYGVLEDYREDVSSKEEERLSLAQEVKQLKEYLRYSENMVKELRVLVGSDPKQKNTTQRNLRVQLKALENEELFMMRSQIERVEQKNTRAEKALEEERKFLSKKARELDLIENNPLKLYEELYESALQEKTVIASLNERIESLRTSENELILNLEKTPDEEAKIKEEQEHHKNSQEVIELLKSELHVLQEEVRKEKEMNSKQMSFLTERFEKSCEILQQKLVDTMKASENFENNSKALHELAAKMKIQHQSNMKEIYEDCNKKLGNHRDIMAAVVQEYKKIKEEIFSYGNHYRESLEDAQNKYRGVLERLENFVEDIENNFEARKKNAAVDLGRKKKIEEDVIKENLNLYNLLQNQITGLKRQLEDAEDSRIQEKGALVNFIENFKQALMQMKHRIAQDREKFEGESEFYKRLLEQKDAQHEEEIRVLSIRYANESRKEEVRE